MASDSKPAGHLEENSGCNCVSANINVTKLQAEVESAPIYILPSSCVITLNKDDISEQNDGDNDNI